jgi:hypothetical protein
MSNSDELESMFIDQIQDEEDLEQEIMRNVRAIDDRLKRNWTKRRKNWKQLDYKRFR